MDPFSTMSEDLKMKTAGILLFVGAAQFFLLMLVAVATYPGYSVSGNYISDLGVGSTAFIFDGSIIALGILTLVSALFLKDRSKAILITILLAGIGAIGVGVFTENSGSYHFFASLIVFLFASLASYAVLARERKAITVVFAVLGSIALVALVLYGMDTYLGLGKGGMERMIAYPNLFWIMGYGGFLYSRPD